MCQLAHPFLFSYFSFLFLPYPFLVFPYSHFFLSFPRVRKISKL